MLHIKIQLEKIASYLKLRKTVIDLRMPKIKSIFVTFANSLDPDRPTFCWVWAGSKLSDTLMVIMKFFLEKNAEDKNQAKLSSRLRIKCTLQCIIIIILKCLW